MTDQTHAMTTRGGFDALDAADRARRASREARAWDAALAAALAAKAAEALAPADGQSDPSGRASQQADGGGDTAE